MRYRILEKRLNNGKILYSPQCRATIFNCWRNVIFDALKYYWDSSVVSRDYETYKEANLHVEGHRKHKLEQYGMRVKATKKHEVNNL